MNSLQEELLTVGDNYDSDTSDSGTVVGSLIISSDDSDSSSPSLFNSTSSSGNSSLQLSGSQSLTSTSSTKCASPAELENVTEKSEGVSTASLGDASTEELDDETMEVDEDKNGKESDAGEDQTHPPLKDVELPYTIEPVIVSETTPRKLERKQIPCGARKQDVEIVLASSLPQSKSTGPRKRLLFSPEPGSFSKSLKSRRGNAFGGVSASFPSWSAYHYGQRNCTEGDNLQGPQQLLSEQQLSMLTSTLQTHITNTIKREIESGIKELATLLSEKLSAKEKVQTENVQKQARNKKVDKSGSNCAANVRGKVKTRSQCKADVDSGKKVKSIKNVVPDIGLANIKEEALRLIQSNKEGPNNNNRSRSIVWANKMADPSPALVETLQKYLVLKPLANNNDPSTASSCSSSPELQEGPDAVENPESSAACDNLTSVFNNESNSNSNITNQVEKSEHPVEKHSSEQFLDVFNPSDEDPSYKDEQVEITLDISPELLAEATKIAEGDFATPNALVEVEESTVTEGPGEASSPPPKKIKMNLPVQKTGPELEIKPELPLRKLKESILCVVCGKNFPNHSSLKQHESFHGSQRPFRCQIDGCCKSYKTKSELNRHFIVHSGEKKYECKQCGKKFLRKQYLKTHLLRHDESLTWTCTLCTKIFVSEQDVNKHKISYHKNGKRNVAESMMDSKPLDIMKLDGVKLEAPVVA